MRAIMAWTLGALLAACPPAWPARLPVHDAAESPEYGRKAGGMLGRGGLNLLTWPLDIGVQLVRGTQDGPPVLGTVNGAVRGVGCGVLRIGSGALDVLGFWIPGFYGAPVSDSYEGCLGTPVRIGLRS